MPYEMFYFFHKLCLKFYLFSYDITHLSKTVVNFFINETLTTLTNCAVQQIFYCLIKTWYSLKVMS